MSFCPLNIFSDFYVRSMLQRVAPRNRAVAAGIVSAAAPQALRYLYNAARQAYHDMPRTESKSFRRGVKRKRPTRSYKRSFRRVRPTYSTSRKRKVYKCKIKKLCKFMKQQQAIHIHRNRGVDVLTALAKNANLRCENEGGTLAAHEAAISNLRYYDPATNALVTNNAALGNYSRDISMSIKRKITIANNYHIPCNIEVYSCIPKVDTDSDPIAFFNSGLADQGAPSSASPLIRFKDSDDLKHTWTCSLKRRGVMLPGKVWTVTNFCKEFDYNVATNDAHTDQYQKYQGGHCWVVRIVGTLAHDSIVATEQGVARASVDLMMDSEYRITYDAGKDLHDLSVTDTSTTFTNIGRVSAKPVANNQSYLV